MTRKLDEIDEDILAEGCYHLTQLGLTPDEIATHFETTIENVRRRLRSYEEKVKSGEVVVADVDRAFWASVQKEAEGDEKVTFVSRKGFHHAWKSELRRLDGAALLSIFEASKEFLGTNQNQKFLDYPPPKGYDPLALDREVRKAVEVVSRILEEKWKERGSRKKSGLHRSAHP